MPVALSNARRAWAARHGARPSSSSGEDENGPITRGGVEVRSWERREIFYRRNRNFLRDNRRRPPRVHRRVHSCPGIVATRSEPVIFHGKHTRHDDRFSEFFTNAIREIRRNPRCRRPDRRRTDGDDRRPVRPSTRWRRSIRGRRVYRCAPRRTFGSLKFTRRNLSNKKPVR